MEIFFERIKLLIKDNSAIKEGSDRYSNTCVLDTVLTTFHIAYKCCPNVADLLKRNDFFRHLISLLDNKKYDEARTFCVTELNHGKVDLFGNVEEYFPLFEKLVWPESSPKDCEIIRELKKVGSVFVLGDPSDPPLILVPVAVPNVPIIEPPPNVNDEEKKRNFACIFLLMGKDKHMTMCFQSSEITWHLYDNDPNEPSFRPFNRDHLKYYMTCLAVYVNITQLEEYKGIAETGAGAIPFDIGTRSSLGDPEPYTYSVAIPKTGQGMGPRPYYSNPPNISQISDYLDKPRVEILSNSSGIAETGEGVGLSNEHGGDPPQHSYPQQSVADIEMEDLSCSISETGDRLVRPFEQSCPDVRPDFSNHQQQVEDVEMPSCSSSDSD
ncbi:uncharacterized protein LOC113662035 [Tachysurus fulvidraco]|uniref:uncharacterized protein LOC113662035 n=1 Tax=Tachysurus fulvidraco TaxID=1234273 RepID=UPI000F4DD36C|nr:uncharacterized protein LOC113662035 [Tachysurus fulvidraco]XP_047670165.1 uncharacterized protein LOC113662035 [Tachysurus fulvidraco]XP_047670167.1 uncharacterized protein LOC113662035 [Tachysurus fulvidraco]XP_047670173.1 uncharacterized protein LOC113662035 [Tachysurus fulvidraco]XP_047670181.1 uncharacterized protein LOC113662035 [Tachysurus fulvidraco]XP_047670187.1 uncharacterized protein LOC113662035 [Tachysurus fulvidraco]XP_047670194.1 uncharacterized protein LOC113662035 [Tachys